jgi:hypothetical protein
MKRLVLFSAIILIAGMTYGQSLQKGNLIGTHEFNVTLAPGVTMDKYMDFCNSKIKPEVEKLYENWQVYFLKGIRGEKPDKYLMIYVIKTQKDRDKYYNADGTPNELSNQVSAKMQPLMDELNKLGTFTSAYTDWLVL